VIDLIGHASTLRSPDLAATVIPEQDLTADGGPLRAVAPDVVSRTFDRLVRRYGLPRMTLHGLRHTSASTALVAGIPAKVVSERLGHSNIGITLDLYTHVIEGLDEQAASTVAALVLGGS
jgi:integrase